MQAIKIQLELPRHADNLDDVFVLEQKFANLFICLVIGQGDGCDDIMDDCDQAFNLYIDWVVTVALQDWTTGEESRLRCVVGPIQISGPSFTSMIAAKYVASAAEAKIPVVSVFL